MFLLPTQFTDLLYRSSRQHGLSAPEHEPSLGWTETEARYNRYAESTDRELDTSDKKPSLAVLEQMNQARAWAHPSNRQELEAEHDGREPEEDGDPGSDGEPVLYDEGAREHVHEAHVQAREAPRGLL